MKPVLIVLAVLAIGAQAVPSTCDSCKSMVQNFIDASKSPMKMSQLKVSLSMLCSGSSYKYDCSKTVEKLDIIATKLAPFLADTDAVCSKLQMCGESQFSPLARLVMLYLKKSESIVANDNMKRQEVCDECQASSQQLGQLFGEEFTTYAVKSTLQRLVCRSAGKAHKACNIFVNSVIPSLMVEMRDIFAEKEMMCSNMGFCSASGSVAVKPEAPKQPLTDLWRKMGSRMTSNGEQELMSCFECTLSMDTLLEEFIDKRQGTADDIQKWACGSVVPGAWVPGCNDFVHMYMSTVLFLTFNQFDGRGICTMMHTCEKKNVALDLKSMEFAEKCDHLAQFEQFLVENQQELHAHAVQAISSNLCEKLPTSMMNMCVSSTVRLSQKFFERLSVLAGSRAIGAQMCH